jgi:hypothetical protein
MRYIWILLLLWPVLAGGNTPKGRFVVTFLPSNSTWATTYRQKLVKEGIIPAVLQAVAGEISLPHDIPVTFKDCGNANAFWHREDKDITFCYELLELMHDFYPAQAKRNQLLKTLGHNTTLKATTLFILFHELGHGFVDLFDIPITGREEDAVDQFAALLLLGADPPELEEPGDGLGLYALVGAEFFSSLATETSELTNTELADVHSLGQQRYYDLLCLLVGANEKAYAPLIAPGLLVAIEEINQKPNITPEETKEILEKYEDLNTLPTSRTASCTYEYGIISRSWDRLLDMFVPKRK